MFMRRANASENHKMKHAVVCTINEQQQQQQPTSPWVDRGIF
jgi:hypothetical protein